MKVSKFWHKETGAASDKSGHAYALSAWGNSATSVDDARANALEKLQRWIGKLTKGEQIGEYEYLNQDIREELIEEITDFSGTLIGAITRNKYGAQVLNAADVFIADIDAPNSNFLSRIFSVFGRRDKSYHIEQLKKFSVANPLFHVIVYETHSGLRVFLVDQPYDPATSRSAQMLHTLGSDRLYKSLCSVQKCYRARLTPKPWRCGSTRPPSSFPREFKLQGAFDSWLKDYTKASEKYTVCKPLLTLGSGHISENAKRILQIHDAMAVKNADVFA